MKYIGLLLLLFLSCPVHASEIQHLEGKKASDYIGSSIKQKFTASGYTYEILKRRHRDSMNGRNSDAVIFTNQGDKILYRRRDDGDHWFVINDPDGRVEDPSSDNPLVWNPIANTLKDDHPEPHVFLTEDGRELAVIYVGPKTRIEGKLDRNNRLEVKIKIKQAGRSSQKGVGIR